MTMRRQNIRKMILIVSFLLFPVTIYYFSPYLIIEGVAAGILSGSFLVFAAMFVTSLMFGRLFCGWICPAGGLQECCRLASDKRAKGGRTNWIKYFIWAPWVTLIGFLLIKAGGVKRADFFYQTDHGVSVTNPQSYIIYYAVILLIIVLAFTAGRRSFCHTVCWMAPFMIIGRKISNLIRLPSVRLKADASKCTSCRQCTNKCPMSLPVDEMVKRPTMENPECILCGECADTCPKKVIRYTFK